MSRKYTLSDNDGNWAQIEPVECSTLLEDKRYLFKGKFQASIRNIKQVQFDITQSTGESFVSAIMEAPNGKSFDTSGMYTFEINQTVRQITRGETWEDGRFKNTYVVFRTLVGTETSYRESNHTAITVYSHDIHPEAPAITAQYTDTDVTAFGTTINPKELTGEYVQLKSKPITSVNITTDSRFSDLKYEVKYNVKDTQGEIVYSASGMNGDTLVFNACPFLLQSGIYTTGITVADYFGGANELVQTHYVKPYFKPTIEGVTLQDGTVKGLEGERYSRQAAAISGEPDTYVSDFYGTMARLRATFKSCQLINSDGVDVNATTMTSYAGDTMQSEIIGQTSVNNVYDYSDNDTSPQDGFPTSASWVFKENNEYTITLTIRDIFHSATSKLKISKATAIASIEKYGLAVGMLSGGSAREPRFESKYNAIFYNEVYKNVGNLLIPLGGVTYEFDKEFMTPDVWFDGRSIYRRFVEIPAHTSGTQTFSIATLSEFGTNVKPVRLYGMLFSSSDYSGNAYPLPYAHYTAAQEVALYVESGVAKVYTYGSTRTWGSGFACIEYTRDYYLQKTYYPIKYFTEDSSTVSCSSYAGDDYKAWHAFDGNPETGWWSDSQPSGGWYIDIILPEELYMIDVEFYARACNINERTNITNGFIRATNDTSENPTGGVTVSLSTMINDTYYHIMRRYNINNTEKYRRIRALITNIASYDTTLEEYRKRVNIGALEIRGYTQKQWDQMGINTMSIEGGDEIGDQNPDNSP